MASAICTGVASCSVGAFWPYDSAPPAPDALWQAAQFSR
jgi:hypothetical protein